jgi:hypothetical protein
VRSCLQKKKKKKKLKIERVDHMYFRTIEKLAGEGRRNS